MATNENSGKSYFISGVNLQLEDEIGRGSYGEVWLARLNGVPVAAKRIHSILFEGNPDRFKHELQMEWKVLKKLDHPNIVSTKKMLFPPNESPIMVTELLHSDLEDHIKETKSISPEDCIALALGIAEGLKYLHSLKPDIVVHRDLATKNILLSKERVPKIADLGFARLFPPGKDMSATVPTGTPLYAAPETYPVVKGISVSKSIYGPKVDVFSFGAVVMAMIVGHEPFLWPPDPVKDGSKVSEVVRRKGDIQKMGKHVLHRLVLDCLADESRSRPDAAGIVRQLETLRNNINSPENREASTSTATAEVFDPCIPDVQFEKVPKQQHYDFTFKTLSIGNSGVGKSCLAKKFQEPAFNIKFIASTMQPDIIPHQFLYDSKYVKLSLWDTAGQEKFHSILPMTFRNAHGVFLVFDVTKESTFKQLGGWIELARDEAPQAKVLLVGNKVDLPEKRVVSLERAREFAKLLGFPYVETSAKNIDSIADMFKKMIELLVQAVDNNEINVQVSSVGKTQNAHQTIKPTHETQPKSECCSCES